MQIQLRQNCPACHGLGLIANPVWTAFWDEHPLWRNRLQYPDHVAAAQDWFRERGQMLWTESPRNSTEENRDNGVNPSVSFAAFCSAGKPVELFPMEQLLCSECQGQKSTLQWVNVHVSLDGALHSEEAARSFHRKS